MCGIAGIHSDKYQRFDLQEKIDVMLSKLVYRGPDDEGRYIDNGIAIGNRRLKVIDLKHGGQPIFDPSGKVSIVFNGMIYNYLELKKEIEYPYATHSDTEVILAAYLKYGKACLEKFNGMFAFAIYDSRDHSLFLARDRLGIKPLYLYFRDGVFAFASEAKAIYALNDLPLTFDRGIWNDYLAYGMVPQYRSPFREIRKLLPGHFLIYQKGQYIMERYWDPSEKLVPSQDAREEKLKELLTDSVRLRMRSDVPLGLFLSGGLDSTILLSLASQQQHEIDTFTIGFDGASNQKDIQHSRRLAVMYGTQHHEKILSAKCFLEDEWLFCEGDEPFAITSLFPSFMNSQFARKKVKVVLSGDGADEVFGGYGRYKSWQLLQKMRFLKSAFPQLVDGAYKKFFKKIPIQNLQKLFTYHLHPLVEGLRRNSPGSQYLSYIEKISLEERMKFFDLEKTARFHETQYETFFRYKLRQAPTEDILRFIFSFDLQTSLVDEMLTKVDRASMLNGLELRVPFLDHRIVEYALSLAPETKIKNKGKDILRKTFRREVPSFVLRAAKRGFNVPIDHWIKRELHHSFREIFRSDVVEELGLRKEYLLQDFDRYLQQKTATTGVKYFYFYIFLKWYANFKRNRAFECPYASSS